MDRIVAPIARAAAPSLKSCPNPDCVARKPVYTARMIVLYVTCGTWPRAIALTFPMAVKTENSSNKAIAAVDIQSLSTATSDFGESLVLIFITHEYSQQNCGLHQGGYASTLRRIMINFQIDIDSRPYLSLSQNGNYRLKRCQHLSAADVPGCSIWEGSFRAGSLLSLRRNDGTLHSFMKPRTTCT